MAYMSKLANALLYTPFDDKAIVPKDISESMNPKEFLMECYCKPSFFEENINMQEEAKIAEEDSSVYLKDIKDQIELQKTNYEYFTTWLNDFSNNKIYTISGNAGTGKTTYINHLKYESKDENIDWIILDVCYAQPFVEWPGDVKTIVDSFNLASGKVFSLIMREVWLNLFSGTDENELYSMDAVYEKLSILVHEYENNYRKHYPSGYKLLQDVCKIYQSEQNSMEAIEEIGKTFKRYFDEYSKQEECITDALNILLIIVRCLSKDPRKKFIIVFDNFERFVLQDEIYNKAIDDIRLQLNRFTMNLNEKGKCHRHHFKFVMAIRTSTARMCGIKLQVSDALPQNLLIEDWYNIGEIVRKRKDWYKKFDVMLDNIDTVEKIIDDRKICNDKSITGLKLQIDPLFNNNKRLIIDFIGSMVEKPSNEIYINKFLNMLKENNSHSTFAARSIIRGLLLKELEDNDNLFEHLKTYSMTNTDSGIGDARKILTILNNNKNVDKELSVLNILEQLSHTRDIKNKWNEKPYARMRETFSELLYYMNSYNRRDREWIHFIDIQFRKKEKSITVDNPKELEKILIEDMDNCIIHLMPAGKAYLQYIVASFEFFSLRYCEEYYPLFSVTPTPKEIQEWDKDKKLLCLMIIKKVKKYAVQCIKYMRKKSPDIKLNLDNSKQPVSHEQRIRKQHKSYLDAFNAYIKQKYCESNEISNDIKEKYQELILEITKIRDQYDEVL